MAKDKCVLCGQDSPYEFETHIDYRVGYVEGSGQLCTECHTGKNERQSISVVVSENVILNTPNDFELGEKVRQMFWKLKK